MQLQELQEQAVELLKNLIETQSFSGEENLTADLLQNWFNEHKIPHHRYLNNIWAVNEHFDEAKPTLLLNSHHDTVKPNSGYTREPFKAEIENGKLYGLGSNDAGGCLVSLLATFTYLFSTENLSHNLLFAGTAEEEINGENGIAGLLPEIPKIDVAIVGEPTLMNLAVAEKGLIVFDAVVKGKPSHAAHPNEENSIYKTAKVLEWFQNFRLNEISETLGEVKVTVTQIYAGSQHNVVPAKTHLVIDVRVNDKYSNQEIESILKEKAPVDEIKARSLRLNSSSMPLDHALVKAGIDLGMETYGSPTLSDQAMLSCPSVKLGPGDSTRSHSADEFIYIKEIEEGIGKYIKLLEKALK
ncbi:M20 family metallo-hydrolase [Gramella lutea]|uniref:M20 family metallo-hydrolase n=1 Tax=Christiangramia lutea TaxID=1607951 RepID=A0A9X2AC44_9FLAO|nr:M20 family metallo-hydrolase [Christiangramia lutea]MCH4823723.1 M20 family metallo-hydrolase [Christiangramia lutea]